MSKQKGKKATPTTNLSAISTYADNMHRCIGICTASAGNLMSA